MEMADVVQYFHNSIKCGSKYIMYLLWSVVVSIIGHKMWYQYNTLSAEKIYVTFA